MTHLPRYGPTGRWLVATSLLAVAACSTDRNLTAPRKRPELAISDGAHQGGTGDGTAGTHGRDLWPGWGHASPSHESCGRSALV